MRSNPYIASRPSRSSFAAAVIVLTSCETTIRRSRAANLNTSFRMPFKSKIPKAQEVDRGLPANGALNDFELQVVVGQEAGATHWEDAFPACFCPRSLATTGLGLDRDSSRNFFHNSSCRAKYSVTSLWFAK